MRQSSRRNENGTRKRTEPPTVTATPRRWIRAWLYVAMPRRCWTRAWQTGRRTFSLACPLVVQTRRRRPRVGSRWRTGGGDEGRDGRKGDGSPRKRVGADTDQRDGSDKRSRSPAGYSPGAEYPPMPATQMLQLGEKSPARQASGVSSANQSASNSGAYNSPAKETSDPLELQTETLLNSPPTSPIDRGTSPGYNKRQPPIGPVMPDFGDLARRGSQSLEQPEPNMSNMKRKTSVVKRLRDRVVKT